MDIIKIYQEIGQREKKQKVDKFHILNQYAAKNEILFVGSSLMEGFPINEFLINRGIQKKVYNRGIGGFTIRELAENLEACIFDLEPSKIFINIGTNDISEDGYKIKLLIENYTKLLNKMKQKLPNTKITIMAYYPMNSMEHLEDEGVKAWLSKRSNDLIKEANFELKKMSDLLSCSYVDCNTDLFDEKGQLKLEYTMDGVHMYANGYATVFEKILAYL